MGEAISHPPFCCSFQAVFMASIPELSAEASGVSQNAQNTPT